MKPLVALIVLGACWQSTPPPAQPAAARPAPTEPEPRAIPEPVAVEEPPPAAAPVSLTADVIMDVITKTHMPGIKRCYKEVLKKDPAVKGKLRLTFTVEPGGTVTGAATSGMSTTLEACVTAAMASWTFPANTTGPATFTIPLVLVGD